MGSLVPGLGLCGSFILNAAEVQRIFLGPVPVNHWIEVIEIGISMTGAVGGNQLSLGFAVGSVGDTALPTFQAGQSLIQASDLSVGGKRTLVFNAVQSAYATFRLFPGYFVQSGPAYVLIAGSTDAIASEFDINIAVRTLRLASDGPGRGPEALP